MRKVGSYHRLCQVVDEPTVRKLEYGSASSELKSEKALC
jgi:hypothetical protein